MADNNPTDKPPNAPLEPFDLALLQLNKLLDAYEARQTEKPQIPVDIPRFVTYPCRS